MFPGDSDQVTRGVWYVKRQVQEFSLFHWLFNAIGTVWGQVILPAGEALAKIQKQCR